MDTHIRPNDIARRRDKPRPAKVPSKIQIKVAWQKGIGSIVETGAGLTATTKH
jgi:hypothetical protein